MENEIKALTDAINRFTEERDWDQFHNPKDLAIAISLEASELLEAFLEHAASYNEKETKKSK